MWDEVDAHACAGADLARQFSMHWMPTSIPMPLGCPLKECTSFALKLSSDISVDCSCASSIHIYVDGGFSPDDEDAPKCVSSSTWAFAVFAVDSDGCYKLQFTCGGHVTFCNNSELFEARPIRDPSILSFTAKPWLDCFCCSVTLIGASPYISLMTILVPLIALL